MNKAQITVIVGALFLFVLLLFADQTPRIAPEKEVVEAGTQHVHDLSDLRKHASEKLNEAQLTGVERWEQALEAGEGDKKAVLDSLVKAWDALKMPAMSAQYVEQIAELDDTKDAWFRAAERYYIATRFDPDHRSALFQKSIACYDKVLKMDPQDLDAKTNQAVCFVEGSSDPMKGITLLKEVISTDPEHVNAYLNLGFFSMRSGQVDKAIERFQKVLQIQPDYIEVYLYLADSFEQNGQKEQAIEYLEKYYNAIEDEMIRSEIRKYIDKLKS